MSDVQKGCLSILLICGLIVMGVVTIGQVGASLERCKWQREAVARGVAEYDSKTGEWKWTVERKVAE